MPAKIIYALRAQATARRSTHIDVYTDYALYIYRFYDRAYRRARDGVARAAAVLRRLSPPLARIRPLLLIIIGLPPAEVVPVVQVVR